MVNVFPYETQLLGTRPHDGGRSTYLGGQRVCTEISKSKLESLVLDIVESYLDGNRCVGHRHVVMRRRHNAGRSPRVPAKGGVDLRVKIKAWVVVISEKQTHEGMCSYITG